MTTTTGDEERTDETDGRMMCGCGCVDVWMWMCGYGESVDGFIWLIRVRVFINHRPARQEFFIFFYIFWLCGCIIRTE